MSQHHRKILITITNKRLEDGYIQVDTYIAVGLISSNKIIAPLL